MARSRTWPVAVGDAKQTHQQRDQQGFRWLSSPAPERHLIADTPLFVAPVRQMSQGPLLRERHEYKSRTTT